jgi:hypothetical protein
MKYQVLVKEKWARIVEVEASSPEEALEVAQQTKDSSAWVGDLFIDALPRETWEVIPQPGELPC